MALADLNPRSTSKYFINADLTGADGKLLTINAADSATNGVTTLELANNASDIPVGIVVVGAASDSGSYPGYATSCEIYDTLIGCFDGAVAGAAGVTAGGADLSSGRFVAACNMEVANKLLKLTQVAESGYALASDSQATGYVRTGVTDMSQLKAWFASKLLIPVELVVFPHYVTTQQGGTSSPAIPVVIGGSGGSVLSIFKVAESYGSSGFIQTMTPNPSEATGTVHTYPVYNPQGQGLHIECDLGVTVVGATAGDPANKFAALLELS